MEYTRLGETGLKVSRLALGCMSYGDPTTEGAHRWALADDQAQPFFQQAIELPSPPPAQRPPRERPETRFTTRGPALERRVGSSSGRTLLWRLAALGR